VSELKNAIQVSENEQKEMLTLRAGQLQQIEMLGRLKQQCEGTIREVIEQMSEQIQDLEKEIAQIKRVPGLVMQEVKAVFAKNINKLQNSPVVQTPKGLATLRFKTREVTFFTTGRKGTGNSYCHPTRPDYSNPITSIY
jgi:hypothetical protein